jgi:hypothetical protein
MLKNLEGFAGMLHIFAPKVEVLRTMDILLQEAGTSHPGMVYTNVYPAPCTLHRLVEISNPYSSITAGIENRQDFPAPPFP